MKKTIKEKTNKIYLVMLCGLLVSGAIVCSTNGNGGGENSESPFVCTNGQEVTDSNTTEGENIQNCASCDAGFEEAMQDDGRMICQPGFTCPNGAAVMATADNMPTAAGEENCASCNTDDGFTIEAVEGSDRMVCRAPYVCPNGDIESGTTSMADIENCASCITADFMLEEVQGSNRMVCRTPYVCPNGTIQSGSTTMANVENCATCTMPFTPTMSGSETVCRTPFVCLSGTPASGTTTTANVENCSACDPGFGTPQSSGSESICSGNDLPIALWNAGTHDGDFGFDLCQTILDDTNDTIGSNLTTRGYTKAVFFGSTGTGAGDYLFIDIGSDADALALPATGGGSPVSVSDRSIVVFTESGNPATVNVIGTFGSTPVTRTLDDVTDVTNGGGWQNGGADVVGAAGLTTTTFAWSFASNRTFRSDRSCTGATNNSSANGYLMNSSSVDGNPGATNAVALCEAQRFVLCVAR